MSDPTGTTELRWKCEQCDATIHLTRRLRLGESAAEQAAANTDDLKALIGRSHQHKNKPDE